MVTADHPSARGHTMRDEQRTCCATKVAVVNCSLHRTPEFAVLGDRPDEQIARAIGSRRRNLDGSPTAAVCHRSANGTIDVAGRWRPSTSDIEAGREAPRRHQLGLPLPEEDRQSAEHTRRSPAEGLRLVRHGALSL